MTATRTAILVNGEKVFVDLSGSTDKTVAWRVLFKAAADPTSPEKEIIDAARKLSKTYGAGEQTIPRVHNRHINGKLAGRSSTGAALSLWKPATTVSEIPAPASNMPEIYRDKTGENRYGTRGLPEDVIPALNMDFGNPHLLPPVMDYTKASKVVKPYSAKARSLRPLPRFGNAIGGMGATVGLFAFHSLPLILAGAAVIASSTVVFVRGMDNIKDYELARWWVEYWGAERKLRHWLKLHWNIDVAELTTSGPESDIYKVVQVGMPGNIKIVGEDGKTYTLERATQNGRISIMDHSLTHLAHPADGKPPVQQQIESAPQAPALADPLGQATRERVTQARMLRDRLLVHPELSIEQRHTLNRAQEIIIEAEQLATTLQRLPEAERATIFAALERSIGVAINDIEQVEQAHLQAAVRQAKVLDRYTQGLVN